MDVTFETIQLEECFRMELIDLFNKWRDAIAKIIDEGIKKKAY